MQKQFFGQNITTTQALIDNNITVSVNTTTFACTAVADYAVASDVTINITISYFNTSTNTLGTLTPTITIASGKISGTALVRIQSTYEISFIEATVSPMSDNTYNYICFVDY